MGEIYMTILVFGAFGGIINYFMQEGSSLETVKKTKYQLFKSIFIGLAAAFLVPLFLNMISSDLIVESATDKNKLLVVGGFCLIAAISSKSFINTLSDKLLVDFRKRITEVEEELQPIIEKETESDSASFSFDRSQKRIVGFKDSDTDKIKVLRTLCGGKYTYRSINGIIDETEIGEEEVKAALENLLSNNSVGLSESKNGLRYYITNYGRGLLYTYDKIKAEELTAG
ncbi:MAG: hypothetical protein CVV02_01105 [Firmicutes bacterium HGW-Firmicutes-7]|nr:MAG: hypothetical protein CVV02_01105 [Firmicutes bacterium HGW-Firmicutes-7]